MLKYCSLEFSAVDGIRAVLLAAAVFAFEAGPNGIELVHCGFYPRWGGGQKGGGGRSPLPACVALGPGEPSVQ